MRTLAMPALVLGTAFGQSTDRAPRFEIADVHASPKGGNYRAAPPRGGRFEMKSATMLDLIATSYSFDRDKVLGGPSWLELDKFDVAAKMPDDTPPATRRDMMQQLLAERFKLVTHKETKPLPTWVLTVGKKLQLKEGDGSGETGCKPETASGAPAEGGIRMMTSSNGGPATTIQLGPGMVVSFHCRNMTMAGFADGLRGMMGAFQTLGTTPIKDETGLEGRWNFDVRWSMTMMGPAAMLNQGDRIILQEALEKQLGLKLEQRPVPTPVLVVDSVNRVPSDNPPGSADAFPTLAAPAEFEVADVKPSDPEARMGTFRIQPGGRLVVQNMALRFLLNRAFNTNNNEAVTGLPSWADSARFDITAKAPAVDGAALGPADMEAVSPMMLALMKDRFKMTYHTEDRQVTAYRLVAGKPKMKKADPESRTSCKQPMNTPGAPPGSTVLVCTNATMELFAERLQNLSPELSWPVLDSTGLPGGWDFTLTFMRSFPGMPMMARPVGGDAGPGGGGAMAMPADPQGGTTIFEAVEKQLGLKLEQQKRSMPVVVIDHLEQKPTEN